jgi:hypothetical protein
MDATYATADASPLRYRVSRKLNLFLAKRLSVPRVLAIRLSRLVNVALTPVQQIIRRARARKIGSGPQRLQIDKTSGYALLSPEQLPEIDPAIRCAKRVYEQKSGASALERYDGGKSRKKILVYAGQGAEMCAYPEIMKLALCRPVVDAVTTYLGAVPVLNNVSIMVSIPNDRESGSQLYHLDFADETQIKFFVYVDSVGEENGPFTFVPADRSQTVIKALNYDRNRLQIDEVASVVGADGQCRMVGDSGSGFMVDTSRCLHFGSNKNKETRVAIMIQYTKHTVPEQPPIKWPAAALKRDLALDDIQTMLVEF